MYQFLLTIHSITRWFVLLTLLFAIYRAFIGYRNNKPFRKKDNSIRHWTATVAHIQLIIGIIVYIKSPVSRHFWSNAGEAMTSLHTTFFSIFHSLLMLIAVVFVTIGSAMAKRKIADKEKYRTMLVWFTITLLIICIAIPWPFSPLASRPYFRPF